MTDSRATTCTARTRASLASNASSSSSDSTEVSTTNLADLTRGSGRYKVATGAATMIQGIGAALSTTLAGAIIVVGGYHTAMLTLTGIAVLALALLVVTVPETAQRPSEPLEGAPSGEPARHLL
ncbi:MAG: hypothetical protein QOD04_1949 [Pseudonocardiales bacterium]|jgi:MFS family permease|nr:hypothetical protein [Pseudonocardiales bacterium]